MAVQSRHVASHSAPPSSAGLTRRDFFAAVVDGLRPLLPPALANFSHHANPMLLKVFFANERVHYEVATHAHLDLLEIGLHFEDGPVSTAAYLAWFDRQIVEIKHDLGPELELERWTATWGRLYEMRPLGRLDRRFAGATAQRLAALVAGLQPLVVAAAVAPERSAQPAESRGPWRHWRRR
ncbi:MAG TPA: hypothetical protein VFQ80_07485 [Thermomicrobiales bacterium]|nr:hypothetical protein [Thermomicrobiales bacterium]